MKTLDPGHSYEVDNYGSHPEQPGQGVQTRYYMKRVGDRYPGNEGVPHDGTNCQEDIRVLIDRAKYLNQQIPCSETANIITYLRAALLLFEIRAAREHGLQLPPGLNRDNIESWPVCRVCGHLICRHKK